PFTIREATYTAQAKETLYIDPPPGLDWPRFAVQALSSSISGPFNYPALPPRVEIKGSVLRADALTAATATIVFLATGNSGNQGELVGMDGTTTTTSSL